MSILLKGLINMQYTISETFPYETFDPARHAFAIWAEGLAALFSMEETVEDVLKAKTMLFYLPQEIRSEVIKGAPKPLRYCKKPHKFIVQTRHI